jgi:L-iditol 2-dehydrogenase
LSVLSGAEVIIVDVVDSSLQIARELGAITVINSKKQDARKIIMELTGGRGADIAFECVGGEHMAETLELATSVTRIGGKVVIVGGFEKGKMPIELNWQQLQMSQIQLVFSASYAFWDIYPEMKICLDLLSKGKLNAARMITHSFALEQINEAFETAQNKLETGALFVALKH